MPKLTNFKRIRLEAGYSNLRELSRDCSFDYQSLHDYDNGITIPTLISAAYLTKYFNKIMDRDITIYDLWGDLL